MITCKCTAAEEMMLSSMVPFQGDLKKRKVSDIEALKKSLVDEGLLMPFAIWDHANDYKILDGHGRYAALMSLSTTDADILTQYFPVIPIKADTEDEARKALLQISSSYGKIDKTGLINFSATIPNYTAPIMNKATAHKVKYNKVESTSAIVRLKVPKDKMRELTDILKTVSWIEVY
jgi:hypothetical protein